MSGAGHLNAEVERATAQNFIRWYNKQNGRDLAFSRTPENAPDFVYSDKDGELALEITTVYYGNEHARATNETARGTRRAYAMQEIIDAPESVEWHSVDNPEPRLIASINRGLTNKCQNDYGSECLLVIRVVCPALTSDFELETAVIPHVSVPNNNRFLGMFVTRNQETYFELPNRR